MSGARDSNRAAFPFAAAVIDDLRKHFGAEVKITWASENGREIGKKQEGEGVVPVIWKRTLEEKKKGTAR